MVYVPQEMVFQPPKKAGVSLYVTKKPASKNAKVISNSCKDKQIADFGKQREDFGTQTADWGKHYP